MYKNGDLSATVYKLDGDFTSYFPYTLILARVFFSR